MAFHTMDIDTSLIINLVEKRRQLFDTTLPQYRDKHVKKKLWEEVCQEVIPNWEKLNPEGKIRYSKEIQKRWSSLRDCFRRELSLKNTPSATGVRKKRKYVYFDRLLFLEPFTKIDGNESTFQKYHFPKASAPSGPSTASPTPSSYTNKKIKSADEDISSDNVSQDYAIQSNYNHDRIYNDDEAFLLSLLPALKEFDANEKMSLRVEIMQTIINFKNSLRYADGRVQYFSHETLQPLEHHNAASISRCVPIHQTDSTMYGERAMPFSNDELSDSDCSIVSIL